MTDRQLRDQLAKAYMFACVRKGGAPGSIERLASTAYDMAEAMMKESERREEMQHAKSLR